MTRLAIVLVAFAAVLGVTLHAEANMPYQGTGLTYGHRAAHGHYWLLADMQSTGEQRWIEVDAATYNGCPPTRQCELP